MGGAPPRVGLIRVGTGPAPAEGHRRARRPQPFGAPSTQSAEKVPVPLPSSPTQGQRDRRSHPRGQQGTHGCHPSLPPAPSVRPTSPCFNPTAARGTLGAHPHVSCWGSGDPKGQKRGWGGPVPAPQGRWTSPCVTVTSPSLPRAPLAGKGRTQPCSGSVPPLHKAGAPRGGSPSCSAPRGRRQGARCGADPQPRLLGDRAGDPGWPRRHRCRPSTLGTKALEHPAPIRAPWPPAMVTPLLPQRCGSWGPF